MMYTLFYVFLILSSLWNIYKIYYEYEERRIREQEIDWASIVVGTAFCTSVIAGSTFALLFRENKTQQPIASSTNPPSSTFNLDTSYTDWKPPRAMKPFAPTVDAKRNLKKQIEGLRRRIKNYYF